MVHKISFIVYIWESFLRGSLSKIRVHLGFGDSSCRYLQYVSYFLINTGISHYYQQLIKTI